MGDRWHARSCSLQEPPARGHADGERLFHQYVGASVEGLDDERVVDVVRQDQINCRRPVLVEQLPKVGVDTRRLRLELGNRGSGAARAGLVHVARCAHRDESRRALRQLAVRTQMGASHSPTADYGDAQRIVARQCAISLCTNAARPF